MKTLAIIALAASTLAAPAFAQVPAGVNGAIAHFNQSLDTGDQVTLRPAGEDVTTVSTQSGGFGLAFDIFNASQDSLSDRIDANTATVYSGEPAYAGDIFARLKAESLEDE